MSEKSEPGDSERLDELYRDAEYWHVNTGGKTIHAKRMPGRYRTIKWFTMTVWLSFFLGPYLRWDDRQAVLFDIPARQFHIFNITILPQDVWLLTLALLFSALLLAFVTSLAGRVYCGYFCFQTVWTDVFTLIEQWLEGGPIQRAKLEQAPWHGRKLAIKSLKHMLWLGISVLTGISFTAWFGDARQLWWLYITLQAPLTAWITVAVFTFFTYLFAGHMREQVCFWLCPYARIQGVMVDRETILPAYDVGRGEPRGKLKKGSRAEGGAQGDCIDCRQCIAVCPTGIDIRHGQQEGCITCGLCLDACDAIMDKVHRPHGLIRYASLDEIEHRPHVNIWGRPRVLVYFLIMVASLAGIIYGLATLGAIELRVLHERQPLFVIQSDGSIQNKYELKVLNKTDHDLHIGITASGHAALQLLGADREFTVAPGRVGAFTMFARIPGAQLQVESLPVIWRVMDHDQASITATYQSMFFGPPTIP